MKKRNLILSVVMLILCAFLVTGCEKDGDKTPATKLADSFKEKAKSAKDVEDLANMMNEVIQEVTPYGTIVEVANEDTYFEGVTVDKKDIKSAAAIKPMIGGQPFVAYVFEVENAEDFAKNLEATADLRWNICTSADEAKSAVVGNYVFFVMSKVSFED